MAVSPDASDYKEHGNLYLAVVAEPSSRKTTALKRACRPLFSLQRRSIRNYREVLKLHNQEMDEWMLLPPKERRLITKPEKPARPYRLYVKDFTLEALAQRLLQNLEGERGDPSILYYEDELRSWVRKMNSYRGGRGDDQAFWMDGWSYTDQTVDRKTNDETFEIPSPCPSVLGGIQPGRLNELADKEGRCDGFFERILFAFPTHPGPRRPSSHVHDPIWGRVWGVVVNRLLLLTPQPQENGQPGVSSDGPNPLVLGLTPGAKISLDAWQNAHADEQASCSFMSHLSGSWGKMDGHVLRFALISRLMRAACGEVGELAPCGGPNALRPITLIGPLDDVDIQNAVMLVDYFKAHIAETYRCIQGDTPDDQEVYRFAQWVLSEHQGCVTPWKVYNRKLFRCRSADDVLKLAQKAAARDLGKVEKSHDSRAKWRFVVHRPEWLPGQAPKKKTSPKGKKQ